VPTRDRDETAECDQTSGEQSPAETKQQEPRTIPLHLLPDDQRYRGDGDENHQGQDAEPRSLHARTPFRSLDNFLPFQQPQYRALDEQRRRQGLGGVVVLLCGVAEGGAGEEAMVGKVDVNVVEEPRRPPLPQG
jgi:hypothetical protein